MMRTPEAAPSRSFTLSPHEGETLSLVGETMRILAEGEATGGRVFIFEETTLPGGGPALHIHEHDDEFFYVLEGRFRFVVDGREFFAERGAFVAAPRGSTHAFCNVSEAPGRMLIVCTPSGLEKAFRAADARREELTPEVLARLFEGVGRFVGPPIGVK